MIRGIGIDLCEISRREEALHHPHFVERIFSEAEQACLKARGAGAPQTAAGLFAAKEAFLKALGTGIDHLALREIEVVHDGRGAPAYRLGGPYAELNGTALLSITHEAGIAAAVCVLQQE